MDEKLLLEAFYNLAASLAELRSRVRSLESLADEVGQQHDARVDGLPLKTWLVQKRQEYLQDNLIQLENEAPAIAAKLQQLIDDAGKKRKRGGGS